jgi:tripartite-type tricarboxylate transporter receptor subunit TctC
MPFVSRRLVTGSLVASALAPALKAYAQTGQNYPTKPIKMVVPFPPGGGTDFLARLLAHKMGDSLGQAIIVENKPGAATSIGSDAVAKAAPDGYTILMMLRDMTLNPSLMTLPYDTLKSFAWIGMVAEGPFVLVANPSVPIKSVADLVAAAKAQPGSVSYGSLGVGGFAHICMESMALHLGIKLLHVPYKGAGPALQAAVSGEVAITLAALTGAVPFIRDGRLRALAVGSSTRASQLPDVPTISEAGGGDTILPQYYGLAAPAETPRPVIDRLNAELKRALEAPDVIDNLAKNGLTAAYTTPEGLGTQIAQDIPRFGKVIKVVGITTQ